MTDYQGENFRHFLKRNKISADKAAEILNKNRITVYQYFKSKNLSREVVSNILTSFEVSESEIWGIDPPKTEAVPLRLADPFGHEATIDKIYKLPDDSLIMQVPIIPYRAWGSYLRGHADPEYYEGLATMPVPVEHNHKGTYLIFEIGGDSMVNPGNRRSIWPGEKLIGRDLKKDHWKYKLHFTSVPCWIIVHKDQGIIVKEIVDHNIDTGELTLHCWNPDKNEYPDYKINLNDVDQIFNVVDPFNKFG